MFRQLIGKRQAGRKLVGQVFHGCRVVVGIGTQSQRSRKTLVYGGVIDRSEKSPAHDAQIGMIVERLRTVGVSLLKGGVAILAIVQTGSDSDFPVEEGRTVLKTELSILFRRAEAEHQMLRIAFVVLLIFGVPVVQITVTGNDRLHVRPRIVPVYGSESERLLLNLRQVTEDVFVVFIVGFGV